MWLEILPQIIEEGNRRGLHTLNVDRHTHAQILQEVNKSGSNTEFPQIDAVIDNKTNVYTNMKIARGVNFLIEMTY